MTAMTSELTAELVSGIEPNGPTDPIVYYRRPLIGWLYRERINRGLRLLRRSRFRAALEVGYGSGAVQLAMAERVAELHGVDLDADPAVASSLLRSRGHAATLVRGDVLDLPYQAERFELVWSFSVFEHLRAYREGLQEVVRVLEPGGLLLLGMPSVNRSMELGFRLIGFKGIEDHHVTAPAQVAQAFEGVGLDALATGHLDLPGPRPAGLRLYHNWLLRKRSG